MSSDRSSSSLHASMDRLAVGAAGATPDLLASFNKKTAGLSGYTVTRVLNLKMSLRKKEKAHGSTHDFQRFELGRAAVRPGERHFAVGTDSPEAAQHFLSIVDGQAVLDDMRADPVMCYTRVSEHLSDVKWLNSETLLASTGKGNLKLFHFDSNAQSIKHIGDMKDACSSYIREIAVQPDTANNVAIGGFDSKLNFLDLNRPDNPYVQRLDMQTVIGNVKWAPFHGASYASCGLDEGKFYLFDTRSKITEAAFYIDTRKEDLFTHERYSDFGVMLGYGDGEIKHLDMRQPNKVLHIVQDPFVEAIGGIEYNDESQAFVVSGYTDFSVWNAKDGQQASVHSHSKLDTKSLRGKGYACSATWYDAKTVLSTDNEGTVGLFIQDFDA